MARLKIFFLIYFFFLGFSKYYTHAASGDVKTSHSGTYRLHEDDVEVPVECRNYITFKPLRLESVLPYTTKSVVF